MSTSSNGASGRVAYANDTTESTSTKVEQEFLTFDVVEELTDDPVFSPVDNGIYVSSSFDEQTLVSVAQHLKNAGISRRIARRFIQTLNEQRGKWVGDLLGFKPQSEPGQEVIPADVDIHFGKLYLPALDGFTASITINNTVTANSDLTINIPGLGAGGRKQYECRITQRQTLDHIAVNLVIPATVKVVEWRHRSGDSFHTVHIVNISHTIVGRVVTNPYDSESGYKEISNMPGTVNRYENPHSVMNERVSVKINENTRIGLSLSLALAGAASLKVTGVAILNNQFHINYSLPTGYKYVSFVKHERKLQHLWAYQPLSQ